MRAALSKGRSWLIRLLFLRPGVIMCYTLTVFTKIDDFACTSQALPMNDNFFIFFLIFFGVVAGLVVKGRVSVSVIIFIGRRNPMPTRLGGRMNSELPVALVQDVRTALTH